MFEIELLKCIKTDLALNNLQWLIYPERKPDQTKNLYLYKTELFEIEPVMLDNIRFDCIMFH